MYILGVTLAWHSEMRKGIVVFSPFHSIEIKPMLFFEKKSIFYPMQYWAQTGLFALSLVLR